MALRRRQNPRTAEFNHSIWRSTSEDTFRQHLVTLEERTNAVPVQPQVFPISTFVSTVADENRILPLKVEQRLADDFAYIAAVGEGAQSVAAVCIEERCSPPALCVRFAAVDTINETLQQALQEVGVILERSTNTPDRGDAANHNLLLNTIVQQHFQKLLGRLRSGKWQKPNYLSRTHKKPLWQDFDNLVHRVQFIYPKKKDVKRHETEMCLQHIAEELSKFENNSTKAEDDFKQMIKIVKTCFTMCQSVAVRDFATKLETLPKATNQIAAAIKTLRQVEKIGAYYRIATDLIRAAQRYPALFNTVDLHYLTPYNAISTEIGFENWAKTLHIHAEIQLAVYYDLQDASQSSRSVPNSSLYHSPRTIGTSKYLCYLCYLFIKHHGTFFPSNTHGRLYDQWTIPDLAEYTDKTKHRYEVIIRTIDAEVANLSEELGPKLGKRDAWRVEPMTSRQNLLLALMDGSSGCEPSD